MLIGRIPSSPSVFTSDEYRAWMSRTPSTSALYEQIRATTSRPPRYTYSAENIHAAVNQVFRLIILVLISCCNVQTMTNSSHIYKVSNVFSCSMKYQQDISSASLVRRVITAAMVRTDRFRLRLTVCRRDQRRPNK